MPSCCARAEHEQQRGQRGGQAAAGHVGDGTCLPRSASDRASGRIRAAMLAPVFDAETKQVIGLVELVNKEVTDDLTPEQQQQAAVPPSQAQRQRRRTHA